MNNMTVDTDDSFSSLLELAANNDLAGFKRLIEREISAIDEIELWYGRHNGSKQMVLEHRTPLMVAATYGSVDVLKLILSLSQADVNRSCGLDRRTALHCAASGGSGNAVDIVKLLLDAGANVNSLDADGHKPADIVAASPRFPNLKTALEELLTNNNLVNSDGLSSEHNLRISIGTSNSSSPPLSSSPDNGSPSSASDSTSSPMKNKLCDLPVSSVPEKKEYPIDPSLPDINNSIYATDEFRMFSFKVRPCSRAYSHDWTECPFVHPGENARRRDPRKFHYSCVPCPDFRKGACRRSDMCEYAHGVFECWLHPAQYRTRLCKDGTGCMRRVCFFAHTPEELRPLYVSTGSAVPSPMSSASAAAMVMDMAAALSLFPGSPSSISAMSPSPFAAPRSPSTNVTSPSSPMAWPQPNIPTLHLPGSSVQSSRLRSSLNARDIPTEDYNFSLDDLARFSQQPCLSSPSSLNRPIRSKPLHPSNLEDLFTAEVSSSPRYSDQAAAFSPSHRSKTINQFQQQQQSMLSPINTGRVFSPKNVDHTFLQTSFGLSSPGRMSPRSMETLSPMSSRLSAFAQREKQQQQQQQQQQQELQRQQQLCSLNSRELGPNSVGVVGSPVNSWTKWGSPTGKLDWAVQGDELGRFHKGTSTEMGKINDNEPDLSWIGSLVKESPPEMKVNNTMPLPNGGGLGSFGARSASIGSESSNLNSQSESNDHAVLGAWLEQMQLDQLVTKKPETFF